MINKKIILIPLAAAIIIIGFIFLLPKFSYICELKVYDLKMRLASKLKSQDRIIADRIKIVNVTDSTINEIGWPQKTHHARMIDILSQQEAALIVYDWIFYEPHDELARSVKESGRILWPVSFDLSLDGGYDKENYPPGVLDILKISNIGERKSPYGLWHTTNATISHPSILQYSKAIGHASSRNEEGNPLGDGVYRKMALIVDFSGQIFPSLALQATCNYLNVPFNKIQVYNRKIILPQAISPDTGIVKDIHIPINEHGEMWIYFPGQWEENYFEPFWFENVLDKHKDQSNWMKYHSKFKDNILFVGNASSNSKDTHIIPMEDNFPGVGIHAAALFTILSENFIRFSSQSTNILIILALALLTGVIFNRDSALYSSIFHILLLVGYVVITFWIFGVYRYNIPTLFPAMTIIIGGIASLSYRLREKERLIKEYGEIQSKLQEKDREFIQLVLEQKATKLQADKKDRRMEILEQEKRNLLNKMMKLEKRLTEIKDFSIKPFKKYVPLEEEWEQLRKESLEMGIVTKNKRMLEVFRRAKKSAESKTPVLILGETGTGKGLLARTIHNLSNRKDCSFVTVDCGSLPGTLLESELFGHEKGSFTGAIKQRIGKFEQANKGTIFLDEIGDASPETQQRLLRVLEDHQFERVGGEKSINVDVRIIAATLRNLEKEIENKNFRKDLFYRLNVIPIMLPPLKERKEDIESLADYFIGKYSHQKSKQIRGLSHKALDALIAHNWPGNIREFDNVIERTVALSDGELITDVDLEIAPELGFPFTSESIRSLSNDSTNQTLDPSGDNDFLVLLNKNNFEISKTAKGLGKGPDATRDRFKGLCLKALADNDWDLTRAAESITFDNGNQKQVENKIKEFYNKTLGELSNYDSVEQIKQQLNKKYKNVPKKFRRYILELYETKGRG